MAKCYKSSEIHCLNQRKIFFDANILLYIFWPTDSSSYSLEMAKQYSAIFNRLLKQKNEMIVDFIVISELVNRAVRIEYEKHLQQQSISKNKLPFKKYRDSQEGQEALDDIYQVVKRKIINKFNIAAKVFSKSDLENFLRNDGNCQLLKDRMKKSGCRTVSPIRLRTKNKAEPDMQQSELKTRLRVCMALTGLVLAFYIAGCTSGPLRDARKAFYSNRPSEAMDALAQVNDLSYRDNLLLFMEKGLIFHHLGRYDDSIAELLKASRLMEQQDIISLSQQTASLVTNDWITAYKGEYSERLWVHTYLMMNFLLVSKYDSALVEAKQSLKLFEKYPQALAGDAFSRALIALCYENMGHFNDAYIEYKKLAESLGDSSAIEPDLYRTALKSGLTAEAGKYRKSVSQDKSDPGAGELILFVGTGSAPKKIPGNILIPPSVRFSFPQYEERATGGAEVILMPENACTSLFPRSSVSTSLDRVAKDSLQYRASQIIAKETARAAIKETLARAVDRKNKNNGWGVLLRAVLLVMEEPDTRCWQTLPAMLKILRFPLNPGNYRLKAVIRREGGAYSEEIILPELKLSPGQRVYRSIRVTP